MADPAPPCVNGSQGPDTTMTNTTDPNQEPGPDDERYATIETGNGDTIIYDRESPDAWVQSNLLVDCEA